MRDSEGVIWRKREKEGKYGRMHTYTVTHLRRSSVLPRPFLQGAAPCPFLVTPCPF